MIVNLPDKLYYSIGEVAKAFNVNTSLIRFWEKEFEILKPKKNKKGNRLFSKEDVKHIQTIYRLVKERGYTLEGAKIELKDNKNLKEEMEIVNRLELLKSELLKLKSYFDDVDD